MIDFFAAGYSMLYHTIHHHTATQHTSTTTHQTGGVLQILVFRVIAIWFLVSALRAFTFCIWRFNEYTKKRTMKGKKDGMVIYDALEGVMCFWVYLEWDLVL